MQKSSGNFLQRVRLNRPPRKESTGLCRRLPYSHQKRRNLLFQHHAQLFSHGLRTLPGIASYKQRKGRPRFAIQHF